MTETSKIRPLKLDAEALRLLLIPFAKTKNGIKKAGKALRLKGEELDEFSASLEYLRDEYNSYVAYLALNIPKPADISAMDLLTYIGQIDVHDDKYEKAFSVAGSCLNGDNPITQDKCDHERLRWAVTMFLTGILAQDSKYEGDRSDLH